MRATSLTLLPIHPHAPSQPQLSGGRFMLLRHFPKVFNVINRPLRQSCHSQRRLQGKSRYTRQLKRRELKTRSLWFCRGPRCACPMPHASPTEDCSWTPAATTCPWSTCSTSWKAWPRASSMFSTGTRWMRSRSRWRLPRAGPPRSPRARTALPSRTPCRAWRHSRPSRQTVACASSSRWMSPATPRAGAPASRLSWRTAWASTATTPMTLRWTPPTKARTKCWTHWWGTFPTPWLLPTQPT
mmetsp:Transcript_18950/g.39060  ORF Transcript_18950/g.39060 Transcript_18950/m.39060 type:complete len:242 (-) Transcript_18950:552-1277(-)